MNQHVGGPDPRQRLPPRDSAHEHRAHAAPTCQLLEPPPLGPVAHHHEGVEVGRPGHVLDRAIDPLGHHQPPHADPRSHATQLTPPPRDGIAEVRQLEGRRAHDGDPLDHPGRLPVEGLEQRRGQGLGHEAPRLRATCDRPGHAAPRRCSHPRQQAHIAAVRDHLDPAPSRSAPDRPRAGHGPVAHDPVDGQPPDAKRRARDPAGGAERPTGPLPHPRRHARPAEGAPGGRRHDDHLGPGALELPDLRAHEVPRGVVLAARPARRHDRNTRAHGPKDGSPKRGG